MVFSLPTTLSATTTAPIRQIRHAGFVSILSQQIHPTRRMKAGDRHNRWTLAGGVKTVSHTVGITMLQRICDGYIFPLGREAARLTVKKCKSEAGALVVTGRPWSG